MPKIGTDVLTPFIQNSPGAVGAPSIPNTGAPITEAALHGASTLSSAVAQSGNELTSNILNLGGTIVQGLEQKVAHQRVIKEEKAKQLAGMQNNADMENYFGKYKTQATDIIDKISNNPNITAEQRPKEIQRQLSDFGDSYASTLESNKQVQLGVQSRIAPYNAGMYDSAVNAEGTERIAQSMKLQEATDDTYVNRATTIQGVRDVAARLADPKVHQNLYHMLGEGGATQYIDKKTNQAGFNYAQSVADNDPTKLNATLKSLSDNKITITPDQLHTLSSRKAFAENQTLDSGVKAGQLLALKSQVGLQGWKTEAKNSPEQNKALQETITNGREIAEKEKNKPALENPKDLLTSPPTKYRNNKLASEAQDAVNAAEGQLAVNKEQNRINFRAYQKGETLSQEQTIEAARNEIAAKQSSPEARTATLDAQKTWDTLEAFDPLINRNISKGKYTETSDEVAAFGKAADAWSKAAGQNILPPEFNKSMHAYLESVHTRLVGAVHEQPSMGENAINLIRQALGQPPSDIAKQDAAAVEKAYGHVFNIPKLPAEYILALPKGTTSDAMHIARMASLLEGLKEYKTRNGTLPSIAQIDLWDKKITKRLIDQERQATIDMLNGAAPPSEKVNQ
jgi:hypothetical protein